MANASQWQASNTQEHFNNVAANYERSTGGATRTVAKHVASLISPIASHSKILDNASGTGIVIEEILHSIKDKDVRDSVAFTAVDASPAMIDIIKAKGQSGGSWKIRENQLHAQPLAAENLDSLSSDAFDFSFTVFGFQFFKDARRAADHVYRTLKPGGTAFVTAWADLGYWEAVNSAAEAMGKSEPRLPFGDEWFRSEHLVQLFKGVGFKDVQVHQKSSPFTAGSRRDLAERLAGMFGMPLKMQGWSEGDVEKLPEAMERAFEGYSEGELQVDVGEVRLRMVANVAVCQK